MKLDWAHWGYNMARATIEGGATAVSSSLVSMGLFPDKFDMGSQLGNTLKLMAGCFLVNAVLSAVMKLKQTPLPDVVEDNKP